MIIKVCGMRDARNIRQVEATDANWMGFIFYPHSPRFVGEIPSYMPQKAKRVGIFVNESKEKIIETASLFGLHLVQLHGNESPKFCKQLAEQSELKIIKTFNIGDKFPTELVSEYEGVCNYFLFDTKTPRRGGSGHKFDWELLSDYRGKTPFLLSGGIAIDDAKDILNFSHPMLFGIDINSRFETSPALKDAKKINLFIETIRRRIEKNSAYSRNQLY